MRSVFLPGLLAATLLLMAWLTLRGTVGDEEAHRRAIQVAQAVPFQRCTSVP